MQSSLDIVPSTLNWTEIEEEAARVREQYHFDPQTDSVADLARKIGGDEAIAFLSPDEVDHLDSATLAVRQPGQFTIRLSPITSTARDNFTIAHELGHYFLHTGTPPGSHPITVGRVGTSTLEQQSNRFAAALLMPRERFTEEFWACDGDIPLLAALFKVSRPAAEARAQSLRLLRS